MTCPQCSSGTEFSATEVYFCTSCNDLAHKRRGDHTPGWSQGEGVAVELELLSVLCIETSHYVCFSRDNEGRWLFFDSMADRICESTPAQRTTD